MTDKKISDDQLLKEIRKGKTQKRIAYEYGFGYPSGYLSERCRSLGYRKLNKLNVMSSGGASLSLTRDQIEKVRKLKGFEKDSQLFFERQVLENGDVKLVFRTDEWVEEDDS